MFDLKTLRPLYFFFRLAKDPAELDRVFELRNSSTSPVMLQTIHKKLAEDPQGARAMRLRTKLGALSRDSLAALPEGSLGRAYLAFMDQYGLSPEAIPRGNHDENFVQAHLYETHDLWHVLTGFGADPEGEMGVQGVYAAQLPGVLPAALCAALLLNAAIERSSAKMKQRMDALARGYRIGQRAKLLFGFDFAANLSRPLVSIREELGIVFDDELPLRNVIADMRNDRLAS